MYFFQQAAAIMTDFFPKYIFCILSWRPFGKLLQFPGSICRLGVLSPPAGVWHCILPLEDADLTFVATPDSHSKRSASVQPGENSKDKEFNNFAKAIRFRAVNNKV